MEMMIGKGRGCREVMKGFTVGGGSCHVNVRTVSVRDFMAWMSSSLARWEPYALFSKNCQHFQSELQAGRLRRMLLGANDSELSELLR